MSVRALGWDRVVVRPGAVNAQGMAVSTFGAGSQRRCGTSIADVGFVIATTRSPA